MIARLIFLLFFTTTLFADKNVLVLHSYHHGLQWTDSISKGIIAAFESSEEKINIYFEYLDSKRNLESSFLERTFRYFLLKHNNTAFDVIIASDNDALAFLNDYQHELFPNTPVVFCGINNFDPQMASNLPHVTGVKEVVDYDGTLALAIELFPKRKKVVVVLDNTYTANTIRTEIKEVEKRFNPELDFYYFWDFETQDLEAFIHKHKEDIFVYALAFNRDKKGNFFSYSESIAIIKRLFGSTIPVFGSWDFFLGQGIIGGVIVSGFNQGHTAGTLTLEVLQGKEANTLSIQTNIGKDGIIFDYKEMQRFSLKTPKGLLHVSYINKPIGFFAQHKTVLIPLGVLFLILLIGVLLREFRNHERNQMLKEANALLDQKIALATQESQKNEKLFRFVADSSLYLIWVADTKYNITYINTKVKEYFDLSPQDIIGSHDFPFLSPSYKKELRAQLEALHQDRTLESIAFEFYCDTLDKYMKNTVMPIHDSEGVVDGYKGIIEDITEEKIHLDLLEEAAQTDALTGLLNRSTLEVNYLNLLQKMRLSQEESCLMMIDIDHFKEINDCAGHLMGDNVLKRLAQYLKAYFRKSDLIFRYGGEEFVVLLPDISQKDAYTSAQTLKVKVSEEPFEGIVASLTISIGLTVISKDDSVLMETIAKADEALYRAKKNGRNRVEAFDG